MNEETYFHEMEEKGKAFRERAREIERKSWPSPRRGGSRGSSRVRPFRISQKGEARKKKKKKTKKKTKPEYPN